MSKANALAGLIGNYGDSDDESDESAPRMAKMRADAPYRGVEAPALAPQTTSVTTTAAIHPAPIPHCPWSACYDESSGFTYYWNQQTNAVTWEAPPEYLLALKVAQQQLHTAGSEVSAEEWQLYQQALADKQKVPNKPVKPSFAKPEPKQDKSKDKKDVKNAKYVKKRPLSLSDDEDVKIELITSYSNSDSESNDEADSPVKKTLSPPKPPKPPQPPKGPEKKNPQKKQKTKAAVVEYGPSLPPNQSYTVPIGPELPPDMVVKSPEKVELKTDKDEVKSSPKSQESEDIQDERALLLRLKDKAKILEKLGGEIPSDLQKIIQDETTSRTASPKVDDSKMDTNIDDLLQDIEKKELPKVKKVKIDMFGEESSKSIENSAKNSPRSVTDTPPLEEVKSLFPSSKAITDEQPVSLFPSAVNIEENGIDKPIEKPKSPINTEKKANVYLMDSSEAISAVGKKKLRICNSVLPPKKSDVPAYTTKYSSHIEGFSSERTGLGFKEDEENESPQNAINYGNGLMFTKGETLNEDKKDEALDDMMDLVEAKLKYLNQLQPCIITPVQEMVIQMQTLVGAFRFGALSGAYWRRWLRAAAATLGAHEAAAAPPGWTCAFQRSEGRYQYVRADGLAQWEYPAPPTDMDISTTPPHPSQDTREEPVQPPLPPSPPRPPPTPPPPAWADPPPPGTDDLLPPLPKEPPKQITDELQSFYNDIAALEKQTSAASSPEPPPAPVISETIDVDRDTHSHLNAPERDSKDVKESRDVRDNKDLKDSRDVKERDRVSKEKDRVVKERDRDSKEKDRVAKERDRDVKEKEKGVKERIKDSKERDRDVKERSRDSKERSKDSKEKDKDVKPKKKSKVKISSSIGMKHKSVSSMVAKWQQVADEINSD